MSFIASIIVSLVFASIVTPTTSASDCYMTVYSTNGQNFEITNENLINCTSASIFWSYPSENMTAIFYGDASKSRSFKLCFQNAPYSDIFLYRWDGKQYDRINTDKVPICLNSDDKNRVKVFYKGTGRVQYYGIFINYKIE